MSLPLNNIKVLDLSRLLPGPYCTQALADFGAEVIKIEEPGVGDYMRWENEQVDEAGGAMFHSLNRNKKSITLDLKSENGKEIFKKLVETADVVVESFRPGVMDRLGIGYEVLNSINEKIIYCAITGYGQTGPYKELPGHDSNYLSYAGILELQGRANANPVLSSIQIADLAGGAQQATTGILLALFERTISGKGQFVDISMLDGSFSLLQTSFADYLVNEKEPKRGDLYLSSGLACYDIYKTKDDRYLSVGALEMKFWKEFCRFIGREELIDQLNAPKEVQQSMRVTIQEVLLEKTQKEWIEIFNAVDTCVAPLLTFDEVVENPQIIDRKMVVNVEVGGGNIKQMGIPIKLSRTPGEIRTSAPKLGEHNESVISSLNVSKS